MARAIGALILGSGGALLLYRRHVVHAAEPVDNWRPPRTSWDANWDRRDPKAMADRLAHRKNSRTTTDGGDEKSNERPTASRHLILVRHGQYDQNPTQDELRCLTDVGRRQAIETGKRLSAFDLSYAKLIVSNMTRARETAGLVRSQLPDVPLVECSMLAEGAPCEPEPPVGHWKPEHYFFQDGARIEAAFRKFFHRADVSQKEDSYEIIVCHANVIRYFVCRALQLPPEAWLRMSIANCGITRLTIRPSGRVGLRSLGDAGHLPPDLITYN
ncbi:serine/threonine-protein phosphatase PGAM5, mitochondrial-like isoform X2 [Oscarella lobularis]|uniref:serine/threonine-protein phosphatase PGAM5, mitochondrial-like isoform X2 n=1 Tax=Oscarella lobularis TaxID=121494 RepID=UPI0033137BA2